MDNGQKNLKPISELAKQTPYGAEYLSLRARQGKFAAQKVDGQWMATEEAIKEYLNEQAHIPKGKHDGLEEFYKKYSATTESKSDFGGAQSLTPKDSRSLIPTEQLPATPFVAPTVAPIIPPTTPIAEPVSISEKIIQSTVSISVPEKIIMPRMATASNAVVAWGRVLNALKKFGGRFGAIYVTLSDRIRLFAKNIFSATKIAMLKKIAAPLVVGVTVFLLLIAQPNFSFGEVGGFFEPMARFANFTRERAADMTQAFGETATDLLTNLRDKLSFSSAPATQQTTDNEQLTTITTTTATTTPNVAKTPSIDLSAIKSQIISELSSKGLVTNTIVEKPTIIERAVERVIGGLTQEDLDTQLNVINNKILAQVSDLKNLIAARSDQNFSAIALTNKIDTLNGTHLYSVTAHGVAGLTDADIPNDITASNYMPLTGGAWQGSTIGVSYGGTGITSYAVGDILYADSATTLTKLPIGSAGQVLKITGGLPSWSTDLMGSGGAGAWATTTDSLALYPATITNVVIVGNNATTSTGNILEVTGQSYFNGKVGIGTSSPYAKLSVVGEVVGNYFTATSTTSTSTFPYLSTTQSNLGTIIGGTWQGTVVSPTYGGTGQNSSAWNGIASIVNGVWSSSSTLAVSNGGTGWSNLQANSLLLGNGAGAIATTSAGTNGQILVLASGVPTWTSTSTASASQFGFLSAADWTFFNEKVASSSLSSFVTGAFASSTFPTFTYASSTYVSLAYASSTYPTLTYASSTFLYIPYASSTFPTFTYASSTYVSLAYATSTYLNLADWYATTTSDIAEGTNLYWTTTRFDNRLSATTTLPNLTTLLGLTNASTSLLTVSTLASTTNLIVSATTTTLGLNVTGTATSTFANGLNISAGCFSVNGTCITSGTGSSGTFAWTPTTNYGALTNATNTPIWFQQGLQASSTSYFANASTSLLTVSGRAWFNSSTTFNGVEYLYPSSDGSNGQFLKTNGAGGLSWGTATGSGVPDWQKELNFGVLTLTPTTTIPIWAKDAIYASSTLTVDGLASFSRATSTQLTVTGPAYFDSTTRMNGVNYSWPSADGANGQILATNGAGTLTWSSTTPGTSITPSFYVHRNGVATTVPNGAFVRMDWTSEATPGFDTNNNFDLTNDRFQPTVAGKYLVISSIYCSDNTTSCYSRIHKNGAEVAGGYKTTAGAVVVSTAIIDMNGTTDYLEAYEMNSGGTTVSGYQPWTYFTGSRLDGGSNWTDNGATTYLATGDNAAVGTSTAYSKLSVWATSSVPSVFSAIDTASTTLFTIMNTGNVGIGTTSPYAKLSVVGQVVGEYFTATSTTATSTFMGVIGISTSSPLAKLDVYGNLILSGASRYLNFGDTSGTNGYGFRDNAGTLQFKHTGGTWADVGTGGTSGTATSSTFFVHRNGVSTTTIINNSFQRMDWTTESFDTNNDFDLTNDRFQPTVAGKYLVNVTVLWTGVTVDQFYYDAVIYKNGANYASGRSLGSGSSKQLTSQVSAIVDMNGTTDYIEAYVYQNDGSTESIFGGSNYTYFQGTRIDASSGLWTDGGATTYLATSDNVAVGTSTAYSKLSVWAISTMPSVFSAIDTASTTLFTIMNTGNVGIGTTTPSGVFSVSLPNTANEMVLGLTNSQWAKLKNNGTGGGLRIEASNTIVLQVDSASSTVSGILLTNQYSQINNFISTDGTNPTYLNALGGSVGIGTTTPWGKFSVEMDTTNPTFVISNNGSSTPALYVSSVNGNGNVGIGLIPSNTSETLDVLGSFAVENPAGTDNFFVGTTGVVGIGTSSPTNKFVVSTTASTDGIVLDGTTAPAYWMRSSSVNRFILGLSTSAGNFIGSSAVNDISFRTEGAKMIFSTDSGTNALLTMTSSGANGKVGIGATSPSEKLEVLGAIKFGATTTAPVWDSATRIWMQSGVGTRYDGFTHQFDVGASRTQALRIDSNGNFYLSSGVSAVATGNYLCINTSTYEVTRGNGSTCTTSSGRFKENIVGLSYGLADVLRLNPVVFNYKPEMHMGSTTHLGFIAEEMLPIIPEVVNIGADGLPSGIDYPVLTSLLTKALQETVSILDIRNAATSSQTLLSYYSATGTPAIYVDATGNIGIGTTTPNHKLTIQGEVAAQGFINLSTKDAKKDIVYLNASDEDSALEKIKATNLVTYNYNSDLATTSIRLGLIAEEAPKEVLSLDGKGVDLYKMTSFAWLGLKAQEKKLDNLELRLSELEKQWQYTKGATSTNTLPDAWSNNGGVFAAVVSAFHDIGITFANGLIQAREFLAEKITAKKVVAEVLEMKDSVTNEVYCLKISNGEWSKVKGECAENNIAAASPNATITSTTTVEIIMRGNNPAILQVHDIYGDLGATASTTDQSIIALGIRAFQNGIETATPMIDTSAAGTHEIVYKIVDGNGNVLATAMRTVIIEAPALAPVQNTATTTDQTIISTDTATTTGPVI